MHSGQIGHTQVAPLSHRVSAHTGLIIGLLVLWVVLAVIGFVVKSLFWLAIVGIILFVATGIFGAMRRRAPR